MLKERGTFTSAWRTPARWLPSISFDAMCAYMSKAFRISWFYGYPTYMSKERTYMSEDGSCFAHLCWIIVKPRNTKCQCVTGRIQPSTLHHLDINAVRETFVISNI